MKFNASNVPQVSPFSQKKFDILGDGLNTELVVDLTKAPLGMDFVGDKYPVAVYIQAQNASSGVPRDVIAEVSTEAGKLEFKFSRPLPPMESVSITVSLWYE